MSDKEIVKRSGILDKFEPGDVVMADRGFNIQDLLLAKETKLIIPPFTRKGKQFAKGKVVTTKSVANARIQYAGTGSFSDVQEQGWLAKFFSSVWWPL